jgi:pentatricopeptide repeat protein
MSELHRVLSDDEPDVVAVIKAFDEIASSSSHSHVFSIAELSGVTRALHRVGKRQTHILRSHKADVTRVQEELEALSERASKGLELAILKTIRNQSESSPATALADIDSQMATLFPRPPARDDVRGVKRYRICINYILHMCALAGDVERFEMWESRLKTYGLEKDSYAALATITLAAKTGDADAIVSVYNEAALSITGSADQIILLNNTLWSLAIKGHWERVLPTFYQLVTSSPRLSMAGVIPELQDPLSILPNTQPTAQTFSPLIHALAFQGHFDAALTVFRLMAEHGFRPHVPEYMSLFKGFTRHGIVPESSAGRLASSFPLWERFENPSIEPAGHSVSRIWQRNSAVQEQDSRETATWTESNLREIFESFLHLSPYADQCRAPRPEKVWLIMMAFARTTNGDEATLVDVWDRLESKFGEEGWWGWALDGRLRRLREKMQLSENGTSE